MMMLHILLVLLVQTFRLAACFPLVDEESWVQQQDTMLVSDNDYYATTTTTSRSHITTRDESSASIFAKEIATRLEHINGRHDHFASTQDNKQEEEEDAHDAPALENVPVHQSPADSNNDNSNDDSGDEIESDSDQPFCSGMPMTMFMDGFHWSLWRSHNNDTTNNNNNTTTTTAAAKKQPPPPRCLVYFVSSWELSEEGKFKGAMVFSFLMGLLMEGLSAMRSAVSRHGEKSSASGSNNSNSNSSHSHSHNILFSNRRVHHFLMTFIYAVQGLLGYLLMFLAMAYSMELVLSTVLGLVVGNLCLIRYEYPKVSSRRVDYLPPPASSSASATTTTAASSTGATTTTQTSNNNNKQNNNSNCPEREPLLSSPLLQPSD